MNCIFFKRLLACQTQRIEQFQTPLDATESARMFAVLRFLLPHSIIKISGGREKAFEDDGASLLRGGANGIITAGYLTD